MDPRGGAPEQRDFTSHGETRCLSLLHQICVKRVHLLADQLAKIAALRRPEYQGITRRNFKNNACLGSVDISWLTLNCAMQ